MRKFKWFLDLPIDAKAFDATTFTKNRQRLLNDTIFAPNTTRQRSTIDGRTILHADHGVSDVLRSDSSKR